MVRGEDFEEFVAERRKVGLADVKALEAAWDEYAGLVPETAWGGELRKRLIALLMAGVEYARMEARVKEGENNG
ncbi:hypothetical protein [Leucobacter sp.]